MVRASRSRSSILKSRRKVYRQRVKLNAKGCRKVRARTCKKKKSCKYASGKKRKYCRSAKNTKKRR